MNKIGFENFRGFKKFEPIEYKGITFLVGRNNSGKSTLVKALLLLDNYFKSDDISKIAFGGHLLEDVNVVTYGRAKNNAASGNFISFKYNFELYEIQIIVSGEDDKSFAEVQSVKITDIGQTIEYRFNIANKVVEVIQQLKNDAKAERSKAIEDLEKHILDIKSLIKEQAPAKKSKEYIDYISKKNSLENRLKDWVAAAKNDSAQFEIYLSGDFVERQGFRTIIEKLLDQSYNQYEKEYRDIQKGQTSSANFESLRALKEIGRDDLEAGIGYLMAILNEFKISYLGANLTKQSALFAVRDRNNALAQSIHQFEQLGIKRGHPEYQFVINWMKEFEVGIDFNILMRVGEAYEVLIGDENGQVQLADKGMGSIQVMLLLLRLAVVIKTTKQTIDSGINYRENPVVVIIEEPELNLHPALQSKLADLFLEVHVKHSANFIIETHSEYLVRKSQLLVKENEYEVEPNENPFSVIYFGDDKQWIMNYREDGKFIDEFGPGFFDETRKIVKQML